MRAGELVCGLPLRADMRPAERMSITVQVAEAQVAAHTLSVIHRGLKPGNIMVGDDGTGAAPTDGPTEVARPVRATAPSSSPSSSGS